MAFWPSQLHFVVVKGVRCESSTFANKKIYIDEKLLKCDYLSSIYITEVDSK